MLRLLDNLPILRDFLSREIAGLDRLTDRALARALKKKPKTVQAEEGQKVGVGA